MENLEFNVTCPASLLHPNCIKILNLIHKDGVEYVSNKTVLGDFNLTEEQYLMLTAKLGILATPETILYELAQKIYSEKDHKPICSFSVKRRTT